MYCKATNGMISEKALSRIFAYNSLVSVDYFFCNVALTCTVPPSLA